MKKLPLVSITITTKNEASNIAHCLRSIKEQSYPQENIEIIVVDNNSTDKTKEIARQYTDKVFNRGPERSGQRNYGMLKKSKGNYVMFVDADMRLSSGLIKECVSQMADSDRVGLYIPLRWRGKSWFIRLKGFEREFYDATLLDAARFIRKDVFVRTGGFDERLYAGEDWDLDKRLKQLGKIGLVKNKLYHFESENIKLKDYLKKVVYYSRNFKYYISKWGKNDPDLKRQLGFKYRVFQVYLEKGKWKKIIKTPHLFLGLWLLKLLTALTFLVSKGK